MIPTTVTPNEGDPTGWKAIDELMGFIEGGPPDGSENHDAYIYK